MAKIQIKYITRDNNEIKEFRTKNNFLDDFEINKFLDDFHHFGLTYYKFSKIVGLVFFINDETNKTLIIDKAYLLNNDDIKDIIYFVSNKFRFYKITLELKYTRSNFYKIYEHEKKENLVTIYFNNLSNY